MFVSSNTMKSMLPQYALAQNVPYELLILKFFLCQHFTNDIENIHEASAHCGDLYMSMHVLVDELGNGLHILLYYQMHKFTTKILYSTILDTSRCQEYPLAQLFLKVLFVSKHFIRPCKAFCWGVASILALTFWKSR